MYRGPSQSPNSSQLSALGVHTFVLYVCVSISTLHIRSSVPFFCIPHVSVNIQYMLFSFCFSFWMTVSRSIHVSTNDLNNLIPFYGWVIFHYIHGPHLLYPFTCRWTFRLLPCPGYCKQCCDERWGVYICLNHGHQCGKQQMLERVWRKGNPPTLSVKVAQPRLTFCDPMDYI